MGNPRQRAMTCATFVAEWCFMLRWGNKHKETPMKFTMILTALAVLAIGGTQLSAQRGQGPERGPREAGQERQREAGQAGDREFRREVERRVREEMERRRNARQEARRDREEDAREDKPERDMREGARPRQRHARPGMREGMRPGQRFMRPGMRGEVRPGQRIVIERRVRVEIRREFQRRQGR
jgi:hypothetical protein